MACLRTSEHGIAFEPRHWYKNEPMKTTFSIIAMVVILIVVVMAKCSLDRMAEQEPAPKPIKIHLKP
jgi:hypothetical protein